MFYVGIDNGREKHDYVLVDGKKRVLKRGALPNESWAFEAWCSMVEQECGPGAEIQAVIETANGLATPLDQFLKARGWTLVAIPPDSVKSYRETVLREHNKTDQTDAYALAMLAIDSQGLYQPVQQPRLELMNVTRWRNRVSKDKTRETNRLQATLAAYFPEVTQEKVFKDYDDIYSLLILEHFPDPQELGHLEPSKLRDFLWERGSRVGVERILLIQAVARRNTVAPKEKAYLVRQVQILARQVRQLKKTLAEIDEIIESLAAEDKAVQLLKSWDGIGHVLSSGFMAEVQTLSRFRCESDLASYAGLAMKNVVTGKTSNYRKPQIRANKRLKHYMVEMANCRRLKHAESARYYDKKVAGGQTHLQACRALARHMLRRLYRQLSAL